MIKSITGSLSFDKEDIDHSKITPYGDSLNDGKVQLSFTLPVEDGDKAVEAAKILLLKMGLQDPLIVHHQKLENHFTFFNAYGTVPFTIDYNEIEVDCLTTKVMSMKEINKYIKEKIGRKIIVLGATTGTDAHTVGIDAILNMKGCAGHYGLERYEMIEAYNLGSQVSNEEFLEKALEIQADALLISQTVTQKDVHIKNLLDLIDLVNKKGLREKFLLVCGGARITHDFAKKLGYDAGFGAGKFAEDVASFIVSEIYDRMRFL